MLEIVVPLNQYIKEYKNRGGLIEKKSLVKKNFQFFGKLNNP